MDHGHTVAETDKFVDTLRKLKWTAPDLRELSVDKLIEDIHACGYECEWTPRLAGDLQRSIALKVSSILHLGPRPAEFLRRVDIIHY